MKLTDAVSRKQIADWLKLNDKQRETQVQDVYGYARALLLQWAGDNNSAQSRAVISAMNILFFLPDMVLLTGRLMLSNETPAMARMILAAALLYVAVPADIIPDMVPFAGLTDDVSALTFALIAACNLLAQSPEQVIVTRWDGSQMSVRAIHAALQTMSAPLTAKIQSQMQTWVNASQELNNSLKMSQFTQNTQPAHSVLPNQETGKTK